jgi:hypothetical protein
MSAASRMDILVIPVDADYTITGANSQVDPQVFYSTALRLASYYACTMPS